MTRQEKNELMTELLMCSGDVYLWRYDQSLMLQESNCPSANILDETLTYFGCKEMIRSHMEQSSNPMMIGVPFGLTWAATSGTSDEGEKEIYVIGPVFSNIASTQDIGNYIGLTRHDHVLSPAWIKELQDIIKLLPVQHFTVMIQNLLILHYLVTGQHLTSSDIHYQDVQNDEFQHHKAQKERRRVWTTENLLLQMVREGNMGYKEAMNKASFVSSGVPLKAVDPVRQAKTSVIVFIALCTRAAIEGGMSPEQAYSLGDMYIQNVETCTTIAEAASCSNSMYADFVERVHRIRCGPELSTEIRSVCEYVDQHLEEDLSAKMIAKYIGYAEYYLTKKFFSEMNMSLTDYVKKARIERAKLLLAEGDLSVQEVANQLRFCSRSYFSTIFTKMVGVTPAQYRQKNKRL